MAESYFCTQKTGAADSSNTTELHSILYQKKVVFRIRNVGVFWLW